MRELIEGLEVLIEGKSSGAFDTATVSSFLDVLTSKMTQYDKRASGRPGWNPYAFGQYLAAKDKVYDDVKAHLELDTPEAMKALKKSIGKRFLVDSFPPAKNVMKQIDAYLGSGKMPRLRG